MSLSATATIALRSRIDSILREFFPATLLIGSSQVPAAGPGGKTVSEFMDGGENENYRLPFRIDRTACPVNWIPIKGASIDWLVSATETIPLEIAEISLRPRDDVFAIVCRKRRIP